MTRWDKRNAGHRAPNQGGWSADLGQVEQILKAVDENTRADVRASIGTFLNDHYAPGLEGQSLERHRRKQDLRGVWKVKAAKAALPELVWEFRTSPKYRVLFGENPKTQVVVFLGLIRKADGKTRQTREMENAARRLRRWLED